MIRNLLWILFDLMRDGILVWTALLANASLNSEPDALIFQKIFFVVIVIYAFFSVVTAAINSYEEVQ